MSTFRLKHFIPFIIMKLTALPVLLLISVTIASCVRPARVVRPVARAGQRADVREDRRDMRENRRDEAVNLGPRDRAEDRRDRAEDRIDRRY